MWKWIVLVVTALLLASMGLAGCQCNGGTGTSDGVGKEQSSDGGTSHEHHQGEHIYPDTNDKTDAGNVDVKTPDNDVSDSVTDGGVPMPDFDKSVVLAPKKTPVRNFDSLHFSGAANCSMCHDGLRDNKGQDVSIVKAWSSTMMANAGRDPLWMAKFRSELVRAPHLSSLIQDKCTRCHSPMANQELKKQNKPIQFFGKGGLLDSNNSLYNHAMGGVSCTVCHQIKDSPKLGTLDGFSGKFEIPTYTSKSQRVVYGPYTNPFPNPMQMHLGITPKYGGHVRSSKLCGSCHNLKTPFVDAKGKVVPKTPAAEFPEQMIFSEWKHSSYSDTGKTPTSCQNCHMKQTNGVRISTRPMGNRIQARSPFGQHIFVGGNTFMLTLLKDFNKLLGVTATNFAFTLQKTREMLKSGVSLAVMDKSMSNGELKFRLKITNKSGHKLPTGFPSRRVILHVVVKDASGKVVFESGKPRKDGSITGLDADANGNSYEPHHKVISKPGQVQVYEAIMGNTDNKPTYTLLRAAKYLKDNRILPHGFNKATAPSDIKVAGVASGDTDFVGGSDIVSFRIPGLQGTQFSVTATLYMQSVGYRFAQDLFKDNKHKEVLLFQYLWNNAKFYVEPMNTLQFSL